MTRWRAICTRTMMQVLLLSLALCASIRFFPDDNCRSEKLRELVLETVGIYPHQYSYQNLEQKIKKEKRSVCFFCFCFVLLFSMFYSSPNFYTGIENDFLQVLLTGSSSHRAWIMYWVL
ncbi:unnamed protein product [Nippostrongylus brasiliensis]|uniref:Nose resistant to fluoxetine protein 6 n=1 Tax=Nippostrongylus brasiliensis TaxID=27835 RepID=A0A0N4XPK4_NIPBR|nr:unnamed protein product [Nippostrongylus brasiliensis]